MSSEVTFDYTFSWPAGPKDVILTGTFDDWRGTLPLVKTAKGNFEITMPVKLTNKNDKFQFKFIVDGVWCVSDSYKKEHVSEGIENNFLQITDLVETQEVGSVSRIPEAGGLLCGKPLRAAGPPSTSNRKKNKRNNKKRRSKLKKKSTKNNKKSNENLDDNEEEKEDEDDVTGTTTENVTGTSREETPLSEPTDVSKEASGNFHILPIDQSAETTQSNGIIGGPGPVLVPNPGEIKEFTEIRDVDAKELNERLNKIEQVPEPVVDPTVGSSVGEKISALPQAEDPIVETEETSHNVQELTPQVEAVTPVINEPEPLPTPEAQISIAESSKAEPIEGAFQSELAEKHDSTENVLDTSKNVEKKPKQEEVFTLDPVVNKAPKPSLADGHAAEGKESPAVFEENEKKKKQEEKGSKQVRRSEISREKKPSTKEVRKQSIKAPKKQTASPLSSTTEEPKKKKTGFFGKLKKLFK
ncbi:Crp1p [Saccharomyces paradoxus]|uniref:Cruciform DNA-recognizing protein 1 n=1 Tax=Saccharomyces paradoxus TaxID=27291 RepID=A0A8B8USU7_SACPA|nr:Crp1 [Saccharomyces paradoxus]QHS73782.1 Crp1 [Saccharomyces paradoxus]